MDASMMALRLLVFRSLEKLSQCDKKHRLLVTDESRSNMVLCVVLFAEIVDLVRRFCTDLQFACLFVEVGRQIEPNLLSYLFPLPVTRSSISQRVPPADQPTNIVVAETSTLDRTTARTIAELFNMSVYAGSLQASSSCLPLFSSQRQMTDLLDSALRAFIDNVDVVQCSFDRTSEERQVIGDLFRYAVRVEDAAYNDFFAVDTAHQKDRTQDGLLDKLSESALQESLDESSYFSTDDEVDADDERRASLTSSNCVRGIKRDPFFLSGLASVFDSGQCSESEKAIRRAASSFIECRHELPWTESFGDSLDQDSHPGLFFPEKSDSNGATVANSEDSYKAREGGSIAYSEMFLEKSEPVPKSVATVVGKAILTLIRSFGPRHRWSALGVLSRMLVQSSAPYTSTNILSQAIHRIRFAEIEALLRSLYDEKELGGNNILLCFLSAEIPRCNVQLRVPQHASLIVDLSLFLLDRVAESHDCPGDVLSALVLTGVVATHRSGATAALLESLGETNYMGKLLRSSLSQAPPSYF